MPLTHTKKEGIKLTASYTVEQLARFIVDEKPVSFGIAGKSNCRTHLQILEVGLPHQDEKDGIPIEEREGAITFTARVCGCDVIKCCHRLKTGAEICGWYNETTGNVQLWP